VTPVGLPPDGCEQVLGWFCDALDGAPAVPRARIEAHLAGCSRCRAEAARLAADDALLRGLAASAPPVPRPLLHRIALRLQALPLLPGRGNFHALSDEELDGLAAAGTALPPQRPPDPKKP
jgi:predicted anti-sigma-YlaC factor YlaD